MRGFDSLRATYAVRAFIAVGVALNIQTAIQYVADSRDAKAVLWIVAALAVFIAIFCAAVAFGMFDPGNAGPELLAGFYTTITLLLVFPQVKAHIGVARIMSVVLIFGGLGLAALVERCSARAPEVAK